MGREQRVLYIIDKMSRGGTQTHLDTVIRAVGESHVTPALCCLNETGTLAEELRADGIPVFSMDLEHLLRPRGVVAVYRLARHIREGAFDLVHAYLFSSNLVAPIAAKLAGVPVITSRRDTGFWASPRHHRAYRLINRMTDAISVNSEAVRHATVINEKLDSKKLYLVPNGIGPQPNRRNGSGAIIGSVGNFKPVKGHATLLRAFGALACEHQGLSLHLYGAGPEKRRLRATATAIGLNGEVRFRSGCSGMEALEAIDIFVLPSLSEGCSNALLEAMASGLPVVATDIPANREVIQNGVDGILVPVGQYEPMAEAIRLLVESPERRAALGDAALKKAERYSVGAMIGAMKTMYDVVLNEKGSER